MRDLDKKLLNLTSQNQADDKHDLLQKRHETSSALDIWEYITPKPKIVALSNANILLVEGQAGVGKSQMFAHEAKKLVNQGYEVLLLLGNNFIYHEDMEDQLLKLLQIHDNNFDTFLNILEEIGVRNQRPIVVFIDAINECRDKDIWKSGISQIASSLEAYRYVLANTIHELESDGRISSENKAWARTVATCVNEDTFGRNRHLKFMLNRSHPGLIDLLTTHVRRLTRGLEQDRPSVMDQIHQEAPSRSAPKKEHVPER